MPNSLTQLTDAYEPEVDTGLPVANPYRRIPVYKSEDIVPENKVEGPSVFSQNVDKILNALFRDDEKRLQLWPEKVVREALTSAGDIAKPNPYPEGSEQWQFYESKRQEGMVPAAMAISALAGSGGLAGTGAKAGEVALGATPFLRPALKHKDRLYKGKPGQEHQDIIPKELYEDFSRKAMSGEDLAEYNFGFINDKGHFLDREKALKYGIDNGIIDPHAGKFGVLTTTLMADSSKPGVAIEAMAKANPYATDVFHGTPNNALTELKATRASKKEQMGLKGVHVAEDPAFASIYAGETGNVMPLKAQLGKMLDSTKPVVEGSPEAAFLEDLLKGTGRKPMYMEGANKGDPRVAPPLHTYIDSVGPSKAEKILDKHGYDSVKYQAKYGSLGVGGKGMNVSAESPSYLIREPSNLRSKFAKFDPDDFGKNGLLLADSSKEGAALQANKPTFYSAVEHTVKNINQSKMNGEAWLGTLANKPGVKPEELDWTGLKSFLEENKGKPVTKQQIEQHLASNKIELKEVNKGGITERDKVTPDQIAQDKYKAEWDAKVKEIQELRPKLDDFERKLTNDEYIAVQNKYKDLNFELDDIHDKMIGETIHRMGGLGKPTKYHSYQLPGGENYREMLLTLPDKLANDIDGSLTSIKMFGKPMNELTQPQRAEVVKFMNTKSPAYKSSHWDEPNILAHVRMNDRTIDGKKSLHLEEIQSDWHQQGREHGYKDKNIMDAIYRLRNNKQTDADLDLLMKNNINTKEYDMNKLPDAPFKKTWHELALKRMIREAAEKGYDRLSWTPGEAQAARYDLSKQLKELQYLKNDDGTYQIAGVTKDGGGFNHPDNVPANKLPDIVGKEMAEKIIKNEGRRSRGQPSNGGYFEGVDLKIGGEGMKGFYDQIIPKALEKLGKEHGVKVKTEKINNLNEDALYKKYEAEGYDAGEVERLVAKDMLKKGGGNQVVHYIDLPQSLKDQAIGKGFPLFSNRYMFTPVDYEPEFK